MVAKKVSKKSKPNTKSSIKANVQHSVKPALSSNSGLISYILGIVAIVEAFASPFVGIVLSIIGLIFARDGNSEFSQRGKRLNIVALIIGILILFLIILLSYSKIFALGQ